MKRSLQRALVTATAALSLLSVSQLAAQPGPGGGGQGRNFDPEQFRQQMMDRYREQLGVKSDDEWKLIAERIEKVTEARREVGFGGGMGMRRMGRPPGQGGDNAASTQAGQDRQRGPRAFGGGEPSPEAEALQKGIDDNASADQLKSLMAKYREARKAKEAKLQQAQDELRKVLSVRQEAIAMATGLLN
jgi:hypothetical protein